MRKDGAQLILEDAFNPKSITYTECGKKIEFFIDGESIRVQCSDKSEFQFGMRIPLYAQIAFAQLFTNTLNGQRLLK